MRYGGDSIVPWTSNAVQQVFEAIALVCTRAGAMPLQTFRGSRQT